MKTITITLHCDAYLNNASEDGFNYYGDISPTIDSRLGIAIQVWMEEEGNKDFREEEPYWKAPVIRGERIRFRYSHSPKEETKTMILLREAFKKFLGAKIEMVSGVTTYSGTRNYIPSAHPTNLD